MTGHQNRQGRRAGAAAGRRAAYGLFIAALGPLSFFSGAGRVEGATISETWSGATGEWFDAAQWTPATVPNNTSSNVYTPVINTGTVTLGANATTSGLVLGSPAALNLAGGATLVVKAGGAASTALSGAIDLGPGALLRIQDNNTTLSSPSVTGAGVLWVDVSAFMPGSVSVSNLKVGGASGNGGATLASLGSLTITSSLSLLGGTLTNGGVYVNAGATFSAGGTAPGFLASLLFNDGTLTSFGTLNLAQAVTNTGVTAVTGGALKFNGFTNTGTVTLGAGNFTSTGGGFTNSNLLSLTGGTFSASALTNSGTLSVAGAVVSSLVRNTGIVTVTSGTLSMSGSVATQSGTMTISPLAAASYAGTFVLTDGAVIGGGGSLTTQSASSIVMVQGAATVGAFTFANLLRLGNVLPALMHINGNSTWNSLGQGTTINNVGVTVDPGGSLAVTGGTASTNSALINNGTVAGGSLTLATGANFTNNSLATVLLTMQNGTTFNNAGTASGSLSLSPTAVVNNSGVLTLQTGSTGPGTINNTGTLTVSNQFVTLAGGGTGNGRFAGLPTGSIAFAAPYTLTDGATLSRVGFQTAMTLSGLITADNVGFGAAPGSPGTLSGAATMTLSGVSNWTTGTISGGTTVDVLAGGTLHLGSFNVSASAVIDAATLVNHGVIDNPGNMTSITLKNGSLFKNSGTMTFFGSVTAVGAGSSVVNEGVLSVNTTPGGAIAAPFINSGTVNVSVSLTLAGGGVSTGVINTLSSNGVLFANGYTLSNATLLGGGFKGSVTLDGLTTADRSDLSRISGPGSLTVATSFAASGTLVDNGASVTAQGALLWPTSPGTLTLDHATFTATGNNALNSPTSMIYLKNGGTFINNGTLFASNSFSNVSPLASDGDANNTFINTGTATFTLSNISTLPFKLYNTGTFTLAASSLLVTITGNGTSSGYFTGGPSSLAFSGGHTFKNATLGAATTNTLSFNFFSPVSLEGNVTGYRVGLGNLLSGPGTLTGSGLAWGGGAIANAGGVAVGSGVLVQLTQGFSQTANLPIIGVTGNLAKVLNGTTLTVAADAVAGWTTQAAPRTDQITFSNGAQLVNNGTFNVYLTNGSILSDGNPNNAITNNGNFILPTNAIAAAGTVTLALPFHNAGTLNIQQGTLALPAALSGAGSATVGAGAGLFASTIQLGALTLNGTATAELLPGGGTSQLSSLTLGADTNNAYTARLEIADNPLILQANASNKADILSTLRAELAAGAGGLVGITSKSVLADPSHKSLYVIDNALLHLTTFAGLPVDDNALLVEATWFGDSNLDRKVNVTDLGVLATNYGGPTALGPVGGDFNNDGVVNVTDLGMLATNYGAGTAGTPFSVAADLGGYPVLAAAVPEPASLGVLSLAAALALRRGARRR